MLRLTQKTQSAQTPSAQVVLPYEKRIKCRLRVTLDNGQDAGIFLARGEVLSDGDQLLADSGEIVRILAAEETLSAVHCNDAHLFARACYHLGNRHVPLEIQPRSLYYQHDHVLDDMLTGLGLSVSCVSRAFSPEPGAYGGSAEGDATHSHTHGHAH